jgi:CheY-like chemotaxis protein
VILSLRGFVDRLPEHSQAPSSEARDAPAQRVTADARAQRRVIAGGAGNDGKRTPGHRSLVLIVDDHEDTRDLYSQFLDAVGFGVIEATTCAEALDKARTAEVDAVVLDRRLPDGDGIDVCRALRSDPRTRALPIIVLSGREPQDGIDADLYLLKPVVPDVLVGELERLIARRDGVQP